MTLVVQIRFGAFREIGTENARVLLADRSASQRLQRLVVIRKTRFGESSLTAATPMSLSAQSGACSASLLEGIFLLLQIYSKTHFGGLPTAFHLTGGEASDSLQL